MIRHFSRTKAIALVVVVYIIAALSMLAFALAFRSRIGIKKTDLLIERVQQDEIAFAACLQARSVLEIDDANIDSLNEPWSGEHKLVPAQTYDACDTHVANIDANLWDVNWKLTDESSKINVNLVSADLLQGLHCLDEAAVASILDWIDQDDVPNPDGAENDYYTGLSDPYKCKNGPLDTIEELMLIKGISPQIFYGSNISQEGTHITSAESQVPVDGNQQDNTVGLCDLLTIYGDGWININTTSKEILDAIPFLSDSAVSEIISNQNSPFRKFSSKDDIQKNENFSDSDKLTLLQIAKFNSNYFQLKIKVKKKWRPFYAEYVAIVERNGKNTRLLSWQRKSRTLLKSITLLPTIKTGSDIHKG